GEFGPIEKLFDVMQRDSAKELFILPDDVNVLQAMVNEYLGNVGEGGIARERKRVALYEVSDLRFGQLLSEKGCAFALQGFAIDELFFENTAAVVGDNTTNHE